MHPTLLTLSILLLLPTLSTSNDRVFTAADKSTVLGCRSYNDCNGHGKCLYSKNECECTTGYGSPAEVAVLGYRPSYDCSLKVCALGYSWGDIARHNSTNSNKLTTDMSHKKYECGNMGKCKRDEGYCECNEGFRGEACEYRMCPGKGECSGHGKCVSMRVMAQMSDALPLSDVNENHTSGYHISGGDMGPTWDQDRNLGCVCDSSWAVGLGRGETQEPEWFGPDCSLRRCPSGDNPDTPADETDGFEKTATGGTGVGKAGNLKHHDCSGKGNCDYKSGSCKCFNNYWGKACERRDALAAKG